MCLLAGTYEISSPFYVTRSGTPGHPIVYRAFRRRAVLRWTGPRPITRSYAVVQLANDEHDVQFRGLTIDGAGRASQGLKCDSGARGLAVLDSTIRNTGSAGIATKRCDRVTIVGNLISHTGYDPTVGWSSGVSLNGNVWSDPAPGFHDVVVGNVVSGASDESFHHSEGHGVIVDQSGDGPPVLVADNVVYENGGRCVDAYRSSHVWFVSNTCYADNLDTRLRNVGEIGASVGSDLHFIDNVAYAWAARAPYRIDDATGQFTRNVGYGAGPSLVPRSVIDDQFRVRRVDPLFTAPPAVPPAARGKQRTALPPWEVGIRFVPLPSSPLVGSGVDPRAAVGVTAALRAGMNRYLRTDIRGEPRPKGRGWDIGAYQLP